MTGSVVPAVLEQAGVPRHLAGVHPSGKDEPMYPSFDGEVRNGRLVIDELASRGERLLEGKDVAVVVLDDEQRRGTVAAGRYSGGMLDGAEGKDALRGYEGRQAVVIVRHPMVDGSAPDAFDQKFQLGSKIGDLDT